MRKPTTSRSPASDLLELIEETSTTVMRLGAPFQAHGHALDTLQQRLAQGRFHLAVLGQFKRGKSTLLNALVGEPILPVGVVPLTAAPTFIQFGESLKTSVSFKDDRPVETFTDQGTESQCTFLTRFVTEKGNPENKHGVTGVQVELPAPILSNGVVLIDTPGIGSTYRHNTTATLRFLQQCDAALFLVSADPPITEVELDFLCQVKEKVPRLFFVLNKIDYLSAGELEEAVSFYRSVLAERTGTSSDDPIFCVSARNGMEAKTTRDADQWKVSGMGRLESFLVDFLAREKLNALKTSVCRRAKDRIDAVLMEAGITVKALRLPRQQLEEKIDLFEVSLKRAASERRLIQDVLEGDKKRVSAYVEEQARRLRDAAEQFLKEIMNRGPTGRRPGISARAGIQQAWAEEIPEYFEQQRQALNRRVQQRLLECLTPHEQRLSQLVETLRHTAADLFQVPYKSLKQDQPLEIRKKPYWVLSTWNTDPLPMLQSMEQRLDRLVRRNVENIRWSMLQNLNISLAGFARRTQERLDETVTATKGAMQAAHSQKQVHHESIESAANRMTDAMTALSRMKNSIDVLMTGIDATSAPTDPEAMAAGVA